MGRGTRQWGAWAAVAMVAAVVPPVPLAWADEPRGVLPVAGVVVEAFDPPAVRWAAGHRGVDLAAGPGSTVVAPAAGVVSFAGQVAGRPVLVVTFGALRTTLEPVRATVGVGTRVAAGEAIGVLEAGHACAAPSCLHWGLLRGEEYLDPLGLLAPADVRLLPDSAAADVRRRAAEREAAAQAGPGTLGGGVLARPVDAPITSPFGQRFHPIFREWRLHAGVDLSAPCGTRIVAAAAGTVTHVGFDASGGWRLVVDHGVLGGSQVATSYLHAQGYSVRLGDRVARGQVVGSVGSTGWSTGCHLHLSARVDGRVVDPAPLIGG